MCEPSTCTADATEAYIYTVLSRLHNAVAVFDDNQATGHQAEQLTRNLIHAVYDNRGRGTSNSSGASVTATGIFVSNALAMGIEAMATLQRMVSINFPAVADRAALSALQEFKMTAAKHLLPGLLHIANAAGVVDQFDTHMAEFSKLTPMNR